MKRLILGIGLLVSTVTIAQNNLFSNISTTSEYEHYSQAWDSEKDGTYEVKSQSIVKFETKYLPTGEGYAIQVYSIIKDKENSLTQNSDAVEQHYRCAGYPYESFLKDKYEKNAFVAIGEYIFVVRNISEDGTSFDGIDNIFIKKSTSTTKDGKKKKMSFKEKMKALKEAAISGGAPNYGPAHKELQSKNLDKLITDYLVAMKEKQDKRTATEKQHDKNVVDARNLYNADVNAYNDKIKASPEYKKMKAHQARMKEMENGTSKKMVTIYNKTGKDIYIYADGNRNGTLINTNSSTKVDCSSNYTYKFDSNSGGSGTSFYGANSRCSSSSITVN